MIIVLFFIVVVFSVGTLMVIHAGDKTRSKILSAPPPKPSKVPPPLPINKQQK